MARPWGEVTAEFWAVPEPEPAAYAEEAVAYAEPAPYAEEAVAYAEPAAYAAARQAVPVPVRQAPPVPTQQAVEKLPAAVIAAPAPIPQPIPTAYRERIEALAAKLSLPQTNLGMMLVASEAEHLDAEITAAFGQGDQNTINIRELRGMIANLRGQSTAAARWHLHTTGLQAAISGTGHDLTKASARRAYAMWNAIHDPAEQEEVAAEILPMLTVVAGPGAKPTKAVQRFLAGR
ncbi:hypothetical protein [Kitasatospora indigofera]|uniref:hypothetical protein n=1 Tax=Kitasatospora indigofera TaxID=67307 RepID=UPI0036CEF4DD